MSESPSKAGLIALTLVAAVSYGLGTGWVRFEPPPAFSGAFGRQGPGQHAWPPRDDGMPIPPGHAAYAQPARYGDTGPFDPALERTNALVPTPFPQAIAALAQQPTPAQVDAALALTGVDQPIRTAAQAAQATALSQLNARPDVAGWITEGANRSATPRQTRAAIERAIGQGIGPVVLSAAALSLRQAVAADFATQNPLSSPETVAAATLARPAVTTQAMNAGLDAAVANLNRVRQLITDAANSNADRPRTSFAEEDVKLFLGGTDKPGTDVSLVSDGPTLPVKVDVKMRVINNVEDTRKFDDIGATLDVRLEPVTSGQPSLVPPRPITREARQDTETFEFSLRESGVYTLRVALRHPDRAFEREVRLEVKPNDDKRVPPSVTRVQQSQSDRQVQFNAGFAPVELQSGQFAIVASTSLMQRPLVVMDVDSLALVRNRDGTEVGRLSDGTASTPVTIGVDLDAESLTDQPRRLAVVDLWSRARSEAVTVVIQSGGLPEVTPGIRGRTGKQPEFPEYTPPRTVGTEGFKPSDKVETRVVRLYYYRDAHRVAQIVNRDVQSYNRVAVDTRRRMAERARREADEATDTRRLQEVRAVRSAQASRAAEAMVTQAQAALDAALERERQARVEGPVIAAQLEDAKREATEQEAASKSLQEKIAELNKPGAPPPTNPDELAETRVALTTAISLRNAALARQAELSQRKAEADRLTSATPPSDELRRKLEQARAMVTNLRAGETETSDQALQDQFVEDRARENQFRQEVAAAHEDPDTYAPGKPTSQDPVLQVSVSVIGEGLIQLRGPIKGINTIRTMINQIDAPAAQVRVGIHTIQINGERGERIERVAGRIQDYVDHARFLTAQSGQLLRNAVVKVAAMKAEQAARDCANIPDGAPGPNTQALRDAKYQEAFFGRDFMDELREIDSEFLMTGNKLLSLHSMDTTSLASALFLLALAKNETRELILEEFQRACREDLPQAEANYYAAGAVGRSRQGQHHHRNDFKFMAENARFQSFLGFFNAQVAGTDTINPLQREFLKLAQIFKSRLVTELEYQQRVKERGLIEDRVDAIIDRATARKNEEEARKKREEALRKVLAQRSSVLVNLNENLQFVRSKREENEVALRGVRYHIDLLGGAKATEESRTLVPFRLNDQDKLYIGLKGVRVKRDNRAEVDLEEIDANNSIKENLSQFMLNVTRLEIMAISNLRNFAFNADIHRELGSAQEKLETAVTQLVDDRGALKILLPEGYNQIANLLRDAGQVIANLGAKVAHDFVVIESRVGALGESLSAERLDWRTIWQDWISLRDLIRSSLREGNPLFQATVPRLDAVDQGFRIMIQAILEYETADRIAAFQQRPLDHKRLLDMLIDDVEEKYIELLEGTRAHTANIDAYIKSIATSLDDDFNTQYYYPAFAEIRRASRLWDVTLGKIETTNVLANNRGFGKVEPQATMEFDLPKRDILINEAMNGALAMTKDFGALMADPTFLSAAQLRSGQPTSTLEPGAGFGVNSVRTVLPSLSRSNDERLLSQQGAGRVGFGSAMEALIPDPAVYKFENGTGFEIRPVIQPDGQSVVFHFNYMYTTNIREPVRADEKHLGRVKRHFIDTDVQLGNYELREISRYQLGLKAARTSRGVPLFEDIPGLGILFRPLPSAEAALQENIVLGQSTIFPTLFDLMGLRWAPAVADLDTLRLRNDDFVVRGRARDVANKVFDISSAQVDEFLRVPESERRPDLYRTQRTIPDIHPDGYRGRGLNYRDSQLREGYGPTDLDPPSRFVPSGSRDATLPPLPPDLPAPPPRLPPPAVPPPPRPAVTVLPPTPPQPVPPANVPPTLPRSGDRSGSPPDPPQSPTERPPTAAPGPPPEGPSPFRVEGPVSARPAPRDPGVSRASMTVTTPAPKAAAPAAPKGQEPAKEKRGFFSRFGRGGASR